jgi:hypothetical protein
VEGYGRVGMPHTRVRRMPMDNDTNRNLELKGYEKAPRCYFNPYATELNPILIRLILVAGKVFTHNFDTGKLSAFIQC